MNASLIVILLALISLFTVVISAFTCVLILHIKNKRAIRRAQLSGTDSNGKTP